MLTIEFIILSGKLLRLQIHCIPKSERKLMLGERDLLMLDASIFKLTKRCFRLCYRPDQPEDTVPLDCFSGCVDGYVGSRGWIKERLMEDLDASVKKNEEIYKDFYK
jgi:hypothetical protein